MGCILYHVSVMESVSLSKKLLEGDIHMACVALELRLFLKQA
jgi:hypothetical protein